MKNILLPTDFSENAFNAIRYALQLFKEEPCNFYILNSYSPPMSAPSSGVTTQMLNDSILKALVEDSERGLNESLQKIKDNYANDKHNYTLLPAFDFFNTAVEKAVKKFEIDYVVMGTKGASGLKEVAIGSNTAGLIGNLKCPILAIPQYAEHKSLNELGFAADYEISYTHKGLSPFTSLIPDNNTAVSVLHIMEKGKEMKAEQLNHQQDVRDSLISYNTTFYTLTDINVTAGVRAFCESRKLDMLCLVAKKHNFLDRLLGKTHSKSISSHAEVPLLVLNANTF